MMIGNALIIFIYGLVVLLGGLIGYAKGSQASLIAGTLFALALFASGYGIYKRTVLGYFSAIALSLMLLALFTYRFIGSYKFMPAGLMILISLAVLVSMSRAKVRQL